MGLSTIQISPGDLAEYTARDLRDLHEAGVAFYVRGPRVPEGWYRCLEVSTVDGVWVARIEPVKIRTTHHGQATKSPLPAA